MLQHLQDRKLFCVLPKQKNINTNPASHTLIYNGVLPARYGSQWWNKACGSKQTISDLTLDTLHEIDPYCLNDKKPETRYLRELEENKMLLLKIRSSSKMAPKDIVLFIDKHFAQSSLDKLVPTAFMNKYRDPQPDIIQKMRNIVILNCILNVSI